MTDDDMAKFLGFSADDLNKVPTLITGLSPGRRAVFERMASLEIEVDLWQNGLGPKPSGVLIDTDRKAFR